MTRYLCGEPESTLEFLTLTSVCLALSGNQNYTVSSPFIKIPTDAIVVPDGGIQYVLDANIRNLYQVREAVDGHLQFQLGPTVYRGLWLADVMLTGLPVMMLGDTSATQQFLEGAMHFQLPIGQLRVMYPTVSLI